MREVEVDAWAGETREVDTRRRDSRQPDLFECEKHLSNTFLRGGGNNATTLPDGCKESIYKPWKKFGNSPK